VPLPKKILKIAICTVLYLIVFDVIGVVASFILDVLFSLPVRSASVAAFYALWLVGGVFCGLLNYDTAGGRLYPKVEGNWSKEKDAVSAGRLVRAVAIVVTILACAAANRMLGGNVSDDYFVPDNLPLTVTFCLGVIGGTLVAASAMLPAAKRKSA